MSDCKLSILGDGVMTYYSHMVITVEPGKHVVQGDAIGYIDTRRNEANCECDVVNSKLNSHLDKK